MYSRDSPTLAALESSGALDKLQMVDPTPEFLIQQVLILLALQPHFENLVLTRISWKRLYTLSALTQPSLVNHTMALSGFVLGTEFIMARLFSKCLIYVGTGFLAFTFFKG